MELSESWRHALENLAQLGGERFEARIEGLACVGVWAMVSFGHG
jgi:hypothetical protein